MEGGDGRCFLGHALAALLCQFFLVQKYLRTIPAAEVTGGADVPVKKVM